VDLWLSYSTYQSITSGRLRQRTSFTQKTKRILELIFWGLKMRLEAAIEIQSTHSTSPKISIDRLFWNKILTVIRNISVTQLDFDNNLDFFSQGYLHPGLSLNPRMRCL
jgi:hypothetical protein